MDGRIVLLFGMPRSGTTWLGKLFDAHRETFYLHEPDSARINLALPLLMPEDSVHADTLRQEISVWLADRSEKVIASRPFFPKDYLSQPSWTLFVGTAYAAKLLARLGMPGPVRPLRLNSKAPVIVWKSIESLGRLSAIKNCIKAHSIHILRHPAGHIASTLTGHSAGLFGGEIPVWEDWDLFDKLLAMSNETRLTLQQIQQLSIEERLAVRWGIMNDYALTNSKSDRDNRVLLYEDLCAEPEKVFNSCLAFCSLEADRQSGGFLRASVQGGDLDYYGTSKNPLESAYKWKRKLSPEVKGRIRKIAMMFECGAFYGDEDEWE